MNDERQSRRRPHVEIARTSGVELAAGPLHDVGERYGRAELAEPEQGAMVELGGTILVACDLRDAARGR